MKVSADVRAMIERRKKGHTLEAPFYTSEEILALDMEAIFRQALDSGRGRTGRAGSRATTSPWKSATIRS